jgi:hypothetical protein
MENSLVPGNVELFIPMAGIFKILKGIASNMDSTASKTYVIHSTGIIVSAFKASPFITI